MRIITRYANEARGGSGDQHDRAGGRSVAGDHLGLERHQQQHHPRRCDREPRAVDRPRLAGLELGAGAEVVTEVAGEVAQQSPELAAADLTRDPQALDHPVADRVGEAILEPVQAVSEPSRHLVVEGERLERRAQRLRSPHRERGNRVRQRHPRSHCGGQVVDGLRPDLGELAAPAAYPAGDHRDREVRRQHTRDRRQRSRARDGEHDDAHDRADGAAHEQHRARRHLAHAGIDEQPLEPTRPPHLGARRSRGGERRPDQQGSQPDPKTDQRAHVTLPREADVVRRCRPGRSARCAAASRSRAGADRRGARTPARTR